MMTKTPYWLDHTQWVCTRHVPTARLPESQDRCWYNCGTTRPPNRPAPRVEAEITLPAPPPPVVKMRPPPVVEAPLPPVAKAPPLPPPPKEVAEVVTVVEVAPPELSGLVPSPEERRRGATHLVACLTCGAPLWRRKKDIEGGLKPFCSPAHRAAFARL